MNAQHTPGPWFVVQNGHYCDINTGPEIWDPSIAETCASKHGWGADVESANAHLIAAAPDLFKALETLVKQADAHNIEGAFWDDARAAIAKAKGGQP